MTRGNENRELPRNSSNFYTLIFLNKTFLRLSLLSRRTITVPAKVFSTKVLFQGKKLMARDIFAVVYYTLRKKSEVE